MSIIRKFDQFNEECVVAFSSEGDERLHMPLCGITRCLPGYRIRRNISREYVFEYIIRGKGVYRTGEQVFYPEADDIYIAHAGSTHEYHTDNSDCWEKIWFNVQGSLAAELMHSYRLDDVYYLHESGLHDLFAESLACMRKNLENAYEAATMTVHRLIYHISRQYHGAGTGKNPLALEMKRWMDQKICAPVSLEEMSRRFGFSVSQTIRIFQQEYDETPYRYFLKKKLELAMLMLRNTRKTIKEIAFELNFSDPYYFSNLFKRKYGISPRKAREDSP